MNPLDRQHVTWPELTEPTPQELAAFLVKCTPGTRESFVAAAQSAIAERSLAFMRNVPDIAEARQVLHDAQVTLAGAAYQRQPITERDLGRIAESLRTLLLALPREPEPAYRTTTAQRLLDGDDGAHGLRIRTVQ